MRVKGQIGDAEEGCKLKVAVRETVVLEIPQPSETRQGRRSVKQTGGMLGHGPRCVS